MPYCSAPTGSSSSTWLTARRKLSTGNSSGAGLPALSEIMPGRLAQWNISRTALPWKRCVRWANLTRGPHRFQPGGMSSCRRLASQVAHVPPDVQRHERQHDGDDGIVEPLQDLANLDPVLAQDLAHVHQHDTPDERAGEGVGQELAEVHPRDARRQGNERSDDWQQARKKG